MKVFLSWSGTLSHKLALAFRDWLPYVIQQVEPYVSSEDIDKGARWSTDIARELSDSRFGILCVTRDNLNAPWLMFEAGALSKTIEKTYVCPFLFDIKPSEIDGPILQFQHATFAKQDIRRLLTALNKAGDNEGLPEQRLAESFQVWYPKLKDQLHGFLDEQPTQADEDNATSIETPISRQILEEILELSRDNQKLIRNTDGAREATLTELTNHLHALSARVHRSPDTIPTRRLRRLHRMMLNDALNMSQPEGASAYMSAQMVLALLKDPFPWIYDTGSETLQILRSRKPVREKRAALAHFDQILRHTAEHPSTRRTFGDEADLDDVFHTLFAMIHKTYEERR